MKLNPNTILITGATSGIGLALAERFLRLNNEVIICGRREERLREIQQQHPSIHIRLCDVGDQSQRESLVAWVTKDFPNLNILVNNAGIQRRFDLVQPSEWGRIEEEISINLEAPIHLTQLLIPHLLCLQDAAILNITSGLAFVPMARAPVYCATKAALHSYTLSLRHQLSKTPISVIEVIPPSVNTDLGGVGLHTAGVPLDEFADAVFTGLKNNEIEISYGFSSNTSRASRRELDETFTRMNR